MLKRALEQLKILRRLHRVSGVNELSVDRLLSKFYVKGRSVQVIMEMCNETPAAHKIIVNFVINNIFEKLASTDYFSLMTLRSGRKPF